MADSPAVELKELQVAIHFAPHDPRVEEALGEAYLRAGDNENALYWLAQVPAGVSLRPEARFWAAVAEYRLAGYSRAAQMFGDLELLYPLPSVTADLALAKAQNEHPVSPPPKLQTEFPIASFRQLRQEIASVQAAKVAELPPDQQAEQEVEAGERLGAQGALDAAALAFEKAVAVAQDQHWISSAHAGLAEIWMKRHNADQAQAELRKALAADANNQQALEVQRQLHAPTPPAATRPPKNAH